MSEGLKKYFNYMYGRVFDVNWLTYLRSPLDKELLEDWVYGKGKIVKHSACVNI